jgi:hypothetical protein
LALWTKHQSLLPGKLYGCIVLIGRKDLAKVSLKVCSERRQIAPLTALVVPSKSALSRFQLMERVCRFTSK